MLIELTDVLLCLLYKSIVEDEIATDRDVQLECLNKRNLLAARVVKLIVKF